MSDLVRNPEDRFSRVVAHIMIVCCIVDDSSKKHSPAPEPIQEEKASSPPPTGPQANTLSVHQDDNVSIERICSDFIPQQITMLLSIIHL